MRSDRDQLVDRALWALLLICIAATLYWALVPRPPGAHLFPKADKVFHAVSFASILASFVLAAVWRPGRGAGPFPRAAVPAFAMLLALGMVIELIQGELLGRDADLLDLAAGVLGMSVAVGLLRSWGWQGP
jgi:hypothetical protein